MRYRILGLLRRFGYDIQRYGAYRDPLRRLQQAMDRHGVTTVLDVGANVGQFAQRLRINGYKGRIISFEPLSDGHAKLTHVAQRDALWIVAPRYAVGATCTTVEINIAANSPSSSILSMLDRHLAGDPSSCYVGKEYVETITLDAFFDGQPELRTKNVALKIDTQGYEAQVLAGLDRWQQQVKVIQVEMSLTPLYEKSAGFIDLYRLIESRGFRCISLEPNFIDRKTYEVLQTDAIFEREDACVQVGLNFLTGQFTTDSSRVPENAVSRGLVEGAGCSWTSMQPVSAEVQSDPTVR